MANDRNAPWDEIVKPAWEMVEFDRRELGYVISYVITLGVVAGAVPFASQIVVNQTAFTGTALPVVVLSLFVFGIMVIGVFVKLFQMRLVELLKKRSVVRSMLLATKSLLNAEPSATDIDDRELANRFFDVMSFHDKLALLISEALGVVVLTILGVILLAFYHPFLLAFSIVIVIGTGLIIAPLARQGVNTDYEKSNEKYRLAYWLSQIAEHRALLRQAPENKIIWRLTDSMLTTYVMAHFRYLSLLMVQSGGLFVLQAIASSAFLGLGGWLVVEGRLNLGQLVAAEIIMLSVLGALGKFDKYLDAFYDLVIAAQKVHHLTHGADEHEVISEPEAADFSGLKAIKLVSPHLSRPARLVPGDVVGVSGESKELRSRFLRAFARWQSEMVEVQVEGDGIDFNARNVAHDLALIMVQPAVFRMSLRENLSLLSSTHNLEDEKQRVIHLPLLTGEERERGPDALFEPDFSAADRTRYSVLRAFMTTHPVVVVDQFFQLLETRDQIEFVQSFKRTFPNRILVLHSWDKPVEAFLTQHIHLEGAST